MKDIFGKKERIVTHLAECGVAVPEVLVPRAGVDLEKWATIACDQFTSNDAYWEAMKAHVADAPSTLNMIYPEVYLEKENPTQFKERIAAIHQTMHGYLDSGIFAPPIRTAACIKRDVSGPGYRRSRKGLLICVDLECYDWRASAQTLIRASEATIESRLPPRMDIRRGAALELPHIILLIDDEENLMFDLLENLLGTTDPTYETELFGNSGKVSCRLLRRANDWGFLANCFDFFARKSQSRYGNPFIFAVGDGNHSLASAKAIWEEYKTAHPEDMAHPCRYALVEVENIYDEGLVFEPIHRVVFGASRENAQKLFDAHSGLDGLTFVAVENAQKLAEIVATPCANRVRYGLVSRDCAILVEAGDPHVAATVALERPLAALLKETAGSRIDYIHGDAELLRLAAGDDVTGFLLPPFEKKGFFDTVAQCGALPRKSFSMGHAEEKRFYLECRTLF